MKFSGEEFDVIKSRHGWLYCFGTDLHAIACSQTKDFSSGYILNGRGADPIEDGYFNQNYEADYAQTVLGEGHVLFRKSKIEGETAK